MSSLTNSDPWNTNSNLPTSSSSNATGYHTNNHYTDDEEGDAQTRQRSSSLGMNGQQGAIGSQQLLHDWDKVSVSLQPEVQGKWLGHYKVYQVTLLNRGTTVIRRYSDYVWLNDYLHQHYGFRLIAPLPPKRLSLNGKHALVDASFLERRRRGLQRYSEAIINHPVFGVDSIVQAFFAEPSSERLRALPASRGEEVSERTLSPAEEMSVPQDLEDKLDSFKAKLLGLVDVWTKICQALERTARRRETDSTEYLRLSEHFLNIVDLNSRGLASSHNERESDDEQATSKHLARHADLVLQRAESFGLTTLERAKMHRELYSSFRDLFVRHDKLAPDAVDKLRRRVSGNQTRIETATQAKKDKWEIEVQNLNTKIAEDNAAIEKLLKRRLFIRLCLWNELVWLTRCSTLLHDVLRELAVKERVYEEDLMRNWQELGADIER